MSITLTEEQKSAADFIRNHLTAKKVERQWVTMHGLAGTGKTTVLGAIARENPHAWVCTLTGRAADVLRRKTNAPAMTIHSAFYKLTEKGKFIDGKERLKWAALHDDGDLEGGALLLDESSMINREMAADILKTGVRIVACGDPGQLPPVTGEQFFSNPDVTLKTVHRQALDSPILRQAHWVRLGRGYHADGDDFRVVSKITRKELLDADVIMCWRNSTRKAINLRLRFLKGIESPNPQPGEPVMCLKNAAEYGLFNGATYTLAKEFRDGDSTIHLDIDGWREAVPQVRFEGMKDGVSAFDDMTTHFCFGYSSTVHKFQGSEANNTILIDEYSREDYRKEWLYTGITRAAKSITIVRT